MRNDYVYLNDRIVPSDEAAISPFDIGLLRGYAVFDLLRTVDGRPFLLAEHLERFRSSAAHLGLAVPATDDELASAIDALLERNHPDGEATVRLLLTGGVSADGMRFDPATPTLAIMTHAFPEPPAEIYSQGAALMTVEHTREMPAAKTTNYLTMIANKPRAAEAGAFELLYHENGRVTEGASASVYAVRDGRVLAPGTDVLHGTVGALVLERARSRRDVVACDITLDAMLGADEVFLTSTTRGVVPIVRIDEHAIGDGTPGPITRELMREFDSIIEAARTLPPSRTYPPSTP